MTRTAQFLELQPLLFSIAYRILGQVSEAEDAVQKAWVRYQNIVDEPRSAKSFLCAVVTRICIDVQRSARVRREQYVGPWFPEPLAHDPYTDPERMAELNDSLSYSALLLLERLSALERAAFVLHEVFGFDYAEVAAAVDRSEPACRQLVARARKHVREPRPRFRPDPQARDELAARFVEAMREGDLTGLRQLLTDDVRFVGDGGGKGPAFAHPVESLDRAVRLVQGFAAQLATGLVNLRVQSFNGQPGVLISDQRERVVAVMVLETRGERIAQVRAVVNPETLVHLGEVADAWALRHQIRDELRRR
ncbi:RNA polymerase sigma-70 factor [Glutamicibacter sp. PS]|uniref:RNA polymerase sigma-70 factor n=1 Tax=Glutamicibacter sp. PS TaxID=3075634 RepID=UPI002847C85E|nr:RNA polymerase sigma-70 factor [Glutamicibacter sp. PS]MDR4532881.1 RNA polymerase sigma-70 factor [Glutamicibacter sp. PS]